ncbi:MAG TPA: SDR family oxidoreductase [Thermoleophilaceae bacterium]|nr:SDR family oxidoreductase [Thermoleophilaceae bacterium]
MDVVVAGGHGKVGLRLLRLLAERGDRGRGLIRNPGYAADLEGAGAEPVLCDLEREDDLSPFVEGADAVVFAAGAGPGSGPERKKTVDLGGAVKLIEAAGASGVRRYVIVSSIGAGRPERGSKAMRPYLEAKSEADARLRESGLDYTIVRPGRLTEAPGTGRVAAAASVDRGEIPRDDVAATLAAVLRADNTIGQTFELVGGETPIDEAIRELG